MGISFIITNCAFYLFILSSSTCIDAQVLTTPVPKQCKRAANCTALTQSTCLGVKLPYTSTSTDLAWDSSTQQEIQEKLTLWGGLRNAPKCWEVIQPLLCAVYMPRCENDTIELISKDICEKTRGPCKIVETYQGAWPEFLKCGQSHFRSDCKSSSVKELQFNFNASCEAPLINTNNKESWYEDIEGCGVQCQNPLFTDAEHQEVHLFIGVMCGLCIVSTLFTLLTFIIDWKNAKKYPALILFFINASFFVGSIGWSVQFIPGAREDIVCKSDGTMRTHEPKRIGSGETASCAIVFFIVYYTMMAGVTWFVILAYAWHLQFKALGKPGDAMEGKTAWFHVVAWCLPLVLSIISLAISQIDGDSLSGICFVGYTDHVARGFLLLAPICVALGIGMVFLINGLATLCKVHIESPGLISDKASSKIRETILRLGIFTAMAMTFVIVTTSVHVYIFRQEPEWMDSFRKYVICEANVTVARTISNITGTCEIESRPSLVAMEIHIFSYFGAGIVMSSWVWNKATKDAWARFFRKVFRLPTNKPVKLKKHKLIAQAFAKRRDMNNGGRLSFSFHSTHDDPLGMKFELNSVSSLDMSSAWQAAIPKLVRRRGGMVHPTAGTLRRYSDSDIQSMHSVNIQTLRRLSIESHKSEKDRDIHDNGKKKKKSKKKRMGRNRILPGGVPVSMITGRRGSNGRRGSQASSVRRGSDTSVGTNMSAHSVNIQIEKLNDISPTSSVEDLNKTQTSKKLGVKRPPTAQVPQVQTVNHLTYSMFTASAFKQPDTIELVDLDDEDEGQTGVKGHINGAFVTDETVKPKKSRRGRRSAAYPTDAVVQVKNEDGDSASS